jgi:hypothetical protein
MIVQIPTENSVGKYKDCGSVNTSLLVGLIFIPECWLLIFRVIEILAKSLRNFANLL